jgi:hypothetical protein
MIIIEKYFLMQTEVEVFSHQVSSTWSFTHLGLDIIGPPEETFNNSQDIIVVDYFTEWEEAMPTNWQYNLSR